MATYQLLIQIASCSFNEVAIQPVGGGRGGTVNINTSAQARGRGKDITIKAIKQVSYGCQLTVVRVLMSSLKILQLQNEMKKSQSQLDISAL